MDTILKKYSFLLFLLLPHVTLDEFDKMVENQSNKEIRAQLREFKKGGIEKKISAKLKKVDKVLDYARSFLGTPHQMGGFTTKGMDCSGLVKVVFSKFDIDLPHSSQEQARYGKIIAKVEELKKGDLVFFFDSYKTSRFITHSGIYLGEDDFIHASNSRGVIVSKVNDPHYWGKRFLFGTRFH